jgi:pimeloyl-ACP methyl ester carboxylesterase
MITKLKKELQLTPFIAPFVLSILLLQPLDLAYGQDSLVVFSTRGIFDTETGELSTEPPELSDATTTLGLNGQNCPPEIAIYVHRVWADEQEATEEFGRVDLSVKANTYDIPIIGFSWDSDTPQSPSGWNSAKQIANANGAPLAFFIFDFKLACPDSNVRLVAHSLGARVALSALGILNNAETWNGRNFKIASVHLLGAAADNEKVSKDDQDSADGIVYGQAIEFQVDNFYNLFDPRDNLLEPRFVPPIYYPLFEGNLALGDNGIELGISEPTNYRDINVQSEIPDNSDIDKTDADGDGRCDLTWIYFPPTETCTINFVGDNHLAYIGFRDRGSTFNDFSDDIVVDDGAMNVVVDNWRNPLLP